MQTFRNVPPLCGRIIVFSPRGRSVSFFFGLYLFPPLYCSKKTKREKSHCRPRNDRLLPGQKPNRKPHQHFAGLEIALYRGLDRAENSFTTPHAAVSGNCRSFICRASPNQTTATCVLTLSEGVDRLDNSANKNWLVGQIFIALN